MGFIVKQVKVWYTKNMQSVQTLSKKQKGLPER